VTGAREEELIADEILRASTPNGRWHSEYVGVAYRTAIESSMALVERPRPAVLKIDLWNECIGGARDILGHLGRTGDARLVGLDLSLVVCLRGRARLPGLPVVQADIAALPFRSGSFDAVLDLSTLDHLAEGDAADAIGEYRRVLRDRGVLLLLFWQRSLVTRARLALKRVARREEKAGQCYLPRAKVRSNVANGLVIRKEFTAGLLLLPPHALTGLLLGRLSVERLRRLVRWLARFELSGRARPVLEHVAGMYGLVATRPGGPEPAPPPAVRSGPG